MLHSILSLEAVIQLQWLIDCAEKEGSYTNYPSDLESVELLGMDYAQQISAFQELKEAQAIMTVPHPTDIGCRYVVTELGHQCASVDLYCSSTSAVDEAQNEGHPKPKAYG